SVGGCDLRDSGALSCVIQVTLGGGMQRSRGQIVPARSFSSTALAVQTLRDERSHAGEIIARRAVAFGQLGHLAGDRLGARARLLGNAEALTELTEHGALLVGDLAVETGDPARDRVHEEPIFLRERGAIDRAEIDALARGALDRGDLAQV